MYGQEDKPGRRLGCVSERPQLGSQLTALIKINGHWLARLVLLSQTISAESNARWRSELASLKPGAWRVSRHPD